MKQGEPMKPITSVWRKAARWTRQILLFLVFSAAVVLLLLWLAGKFEKKIPTDIDSPQSLLQVVRHTERVERISLPMTESAVGTIRAVHETSIGSKLLARVEEVFISKAGQRVKAGEILFRLDDTDIKAKLEQAKSAVESAEVAAPRPTRTPSAAEDLLPSRAISRQDYEKAMSLRRSAKADAARAAEALKEVQAALDWATVRAPLDGIVIDKKVDVGDMVVPGQILATLYDPNRMQLVASVRDSLAGMLEDDQVIGVQVEGLDKLCRGTVSEIVPESQAASRSFLVKVTGPCPPGIHSGRFGRIYIPVGKEQVLAIPRGGAARRAIGIRRGRRKTARPSRGRFAPADGQRQSDFGNKWKCFPVCRRGKRSSCPNVTKPSQEANHG